MSIGGGSGVNILVTGGAGFVGSHTVDLLLTNGHDVVVLDNLDSQVHGSANGHPKNLERHTQNTDFRFIQADVRDRNALQAAMEGCESVLHLAAAVGVGQSMYQPHHYCSVNTDGTAQLLDIIANEQTTVQKIVVASSMSIYGEGAYNCEICGPVFPVSRNPSDLSSLYWEVRCPTCGRAVRPAPTTESKPLSSTSIYAITKKMQEELVLCFGQAYKLPVVALRYFNIYGTRQSLSNPYTGLVAIFLSRLLNKKPPIVFEDGLQSRDFINVKDIARANLLALTTAGADFQTVNIGNGASTTVLDVYNTLANVLNIEKNATITGEFRAGDIRHCFADSSRARQLLGWEPTVPLETGLKELLDWCINTAPESRDTVEDSYLELQKRKLVQ